MKWNLNIGLGEKCPISFDFINRFINVSISLDDYLYSPNIIREPPPLHYHRSDSSFVSREKRNQATLLLSLMKGGRIFQNTDFSCWYKLKSPDVYSDEYHKFKEAYDFLDVKVYDDLDLNEYMYFSQFVPGKIDLKLLEREIGGNHPCFRCIFKRNPRTSSISEQPPSKRRRIHQGGKTRRKCKVKKRRNRRRRNTMKRRKTTAKRRYR